VNLIEYKGREPIKVENLVRLLVTGNPDWIFPVTMDERRPAVLDIGEEHMRDHAYFSAIDEQMDSGGREALLYHLLNFDLSKVDLRTIPKTSALRDQKIASLSPEDGWWLDVLQSGRLPYGTGEPGTCATDHLFNAYISHAQKMQAKERSIEVLLGRYLRKALGDLPLGRRRTTYRAYDGAEEYGPVYEFPPLAECRKAFASRLGHEIEWGEPEAWLPEPVRRARPGEYPF
jgi:hypothetical protein